MGSCHICHLARERDPFHLNIATGRRTHKSMLFQQKDNIFAKKTYRWRCDQTAREVRRKRGRRRSVYVKRRVEAGLTKFDTWRYYSSWVAYGCDFHHMRVGNGILREYAFNPEALKFHLGRRTFSCVRFFHLLRIHGWDLPLNIAQFVGPVVIEVFCLSSCTLNVSLDDISSWPICLIDGRYFFVMFFFLLLIVSDKFLFLFFLNNFSFFFYF